MVKTLSVQNNNKRILKAAREKDEIIYKVRSTKKQQSFQWRL